VSAAASTSTPRLPAMCPHGREASVCFTCVMTTRRRQDAPRSLPPYGRSSGGRTGVSKSLPDAKLLGEMRDTASEKPLAAAQKRLGNRGPRPSHSRYARYRRRHPEYVARERVRLERLRARHTGEVAS
jgi:hypothetical protein